MESNNLENINILLTRQNRRRHMLYSASMAFCRFHLRWQNQGHQRSKHRLQENHRASQDEFLRFGDPLEPNAQEKAYQKYGGRYFISIGGNFNLLLKLENEVFWWMYNRNLVILSPYGSEKWCATSFARPHFRLVNEFSRFGRFWCFFAEKRSHFHCICYKTNIPGWSKTKTDILAQLCSSPYRILTNVYAINVDSFQLFQNLRFIWVSHTFQFFVYVLPIGIWQFL